MVNIIFGGLWRCNYLLRSQINNLNMTKNIFD
jgi:hypothetical protein